MRLPLLAALAIALPTLASAQDRYVDREGVMGAARGPAAPAMIAELERKSRPCNDMSGVPTKCALVETGIAADAVYGETSIGERLAFLSVRWQSDPTGNAMDHHGFVFMDTGRGYRLVAERPIEGETVSAVRFQSGLVTYVTEELRATDSRSNPTGGKRSSIAFRVPRDKTD